MMVVTYQLAYMTTQHTDLCAACVDRDDHERGTLGAVQHGAHDGRCEGQQHRRANDVEYASKDHSLGK